MILYLTPEIYLLTPSSHLTLRRICRRVKQRVEGMPHWGMGLKGDGIDYEEVCSASRRMEMDDDLRSVGGTPTKRGCTAGKPVGSP